MRALCKLSTFALLATVVGCTAPATAPDKPSWDLDVAPIIRGSCSHCHGEAAPKIVPAFRFDVCDPAALVDATGVGFGGESILGAASPAVFLKIVEDLDDSKGRPKMPPSPAAPLGDYEVAVLRNWAKVAMEAGSPPMACRKQGPNREPKAKLIGTREDGNDLIATIEISDSDGDQVFAKVTSGSATADVRSVGRRDVTLAGANRGDTITIKMSDGYSAPETSF